MGEVKDGRSVTELIGEHQDTELEGSKFVYELEHPLHGAELDGGVTATNKETLERKSGWI